MLRTRALVALVAVAVLAAIPATSLGKSARSGATPLPSSACGPLQYKGSGSPDKIIVSDLPLQGANRALTTEMATAVQFILAQRGWKAGKFKIGFQSCDDSTASAGSWDSAKCTSNARAYANNKDMIGLVGTFNSGCAKLEIPILNRASGGPIPMVSPSNTYPGLTVGGPGTSKGEPGVYYPTGKRNYARVVWSDRFQGAANAVFAKEKGVKKVFILNDKETYGIGIATLFKRAAGKVGGIKVVGFQAWDKGATSYESLASKIKGSGADSVFLGGIVCNNGGKLLKDLRKVLGAKFGIFGPDGWTPIDDATIKLAGPAANGMYISQPGIPISKLSGAGKKWAAAFAKSRGGKQPDPYTAYAAQAAEVLLTAIASSDGSRASASSKLFGTTITNGILGNFKIDKNGDTTLGTVTFWVVKNGKSVLVKTITPKLSLVG
ncbi:MAG: branched-chain amino acid transport system substrate-binding protein [Gaiellaceae bacterium]|nr:branched-chain amino acid transport system substrate-binding protein [Gaiellaceae bacterium]